jgi:hypothetical protein
MATIAAASASYAHVAAAIALASVGDSVTVPEGTVTWSNQLAVTKGIKLIGAGIGKTVIASGYTAQSLYDPLIVFESPTPDPFRLSGMTIDLAGKGVGIGLYNESVIPYLANRIDNIRILGSPNRVIMVYGAIYGVIHDCIIESNVAFPITCFGYNEFTWNNFTFAFGSADNMYIEDCTFTISDSAFEGGLGGRYCARYNTFTFSNPSSGLFPWFDVHGNQDNLATMGMESYENTVSAGSSNVAIADLRGGKCLVYNNSVTTSGNVSLGIREEVLDSSSPPATASDGQPQHISSTYVWGNKKNTVVTPYGSITGTVDYGGAKGLVPQLNRDAWVQGASFDGTTGVGMGLLAARPATCTKGVGYWATDTKTLYRAAATNTWEEYYKPYTYPHPLREEGEEMENKTISFNLVVTAASDFFLAVAPASLEINPGNTATFTISVTGAGGYNKQLRFTVTGVPAGCLATFSPVTIGAGQSTVLTIITPGTLSLGTYAITATATEV